MKKRSKKKRSAAQRAATARMIAAMKAKRRSNPKRKRKASRMAKRKSNPRAKRRSTKRRRNPAVIAVRRSNPKRRRHHHHAKRRSNPRRRRHNPDMLMTAYEIAKPLLFGLLCAGVGIGGSYGLAKAGFTTQTKVIAANLGAGALAGIAVGQLDEAAGIVAAMPFMVTAMQNLMAKLQGSSSSGGASTPAAHAAPVSGIRVDDRLLGGIVSKNLDNSLAGILTRDLQGARAARG